MMWNTKVEVRKLDGLVDIDDEETTRLHLSREGILSVDGKKYPIANGIIDYQKGYVRYKNILIDWLRPVPLPTEVQDDGSIVWCLSYNLIRPAVVKQLDVKVDGMIELKIEKGGDWIKVENDEKMLQLPRRYGLIYMILNGKVKLGTRPISLKIGGV